MLTFCGGLRSRPRGRAIRYPLSSAGGTCSGETPAQPRTVQGKGGAREGKEWLSQTELHTASTTREKRDLVRFTFYRDRSGEDRGGHPKELDYGVSIVVFLRFSSGFCSSFSISSVYFCDNAAHSRVASILKILYLAHSSGPSAVPL